MPQNINSSKAITESFLLKKTIVLVGLMGAGKTTVGKRLASTLEVSFQDSDHEIEAAAGCSIPDVFEIHGEKIFRDLEQRVITRLLDEEEPKILATGGGAWMNPEIRKQIKEKAISIWLHADLDVLVDRVSRRNGRTTNIRPLLEKGDKRAILEKLMEERYPVYAQADYTVPSDNAEHKKVVERIIKLLKEAQFN